MKFFTKRRFITFTLEWVVLAVGVRCSGQSSAVTYPLDPLSRDELLTAVRILKTEEKLCDACRVATLTLHEPLKQEVLNFNPGDPADRVAFAVIYDRGANKTFEALVDVGIGRLQSWKEVAGVQPSYLAEDGKIIDEVIRKDPRWKEAMLKRGIQDTSQIKIDSWPSGYYGTVLASSHRVREAISYIMGDSKNFMKAPSVSCSR